MKIDEEHLFEEQARVVLFFYGTSISRPPYMVFSGERGREREREIEREKNREREREKLEFQFWYPCVNMN